jgi:titin
VPVTKEAPLSFAAARPALPSSSLRVGSTFVVTSAADTGAGSLRVAITSANALAGLDRIEFAIPGSGVQLITLKTVLPTITSPVVIDGTTQPGYAGSPLVEVTWGGVVAAANGLTITAGSSTVRGLILNGFPTTGATTGYAIWLDIQGGNVVEGCWIGLDPTGAAARPNGNVGITIRGGSGFNRIGGYTAAARNVIAGNATTALSITSGGTGRNRIVGNWFGLNATGTAVLPNGGNNLFIAAPDDTIGGTEPGARNVITGSGAGFPDVFLANTAPRTIVRGNWIGLMPSGTAEGNSPANGINVRSADNVIGDLSTDGRNVIGGTDRAAIYVFSATALRNRIHGNYLGTDATGMVALGDHTGITIDTASDNTIGGVTFLSRNVIGGMTGPAVSLITGSTRNTVIGNYLGVGADGLVALPNGDGVQIMDAPGNRIGGTSSGERNVISGNNGFGVVVRGAAATGNRIIGNWIGPAADSSALGNIKAGVFVGASRDTVGGLFGGEANTIAFNFAEGIVESSGTGSPLAGNHIHSNTGRGIDPSLRPHAATTRSISTRARTGCRTSRRSTR